MTGRPDQRATLERSAAPEVGQGPGVPTVASGAAPLGAATVGSGAAPSGSAPSGSAPSGSALAGMGARRAGLGGGSDSSPELSRRHLLSVGDLGADGIATVLRLSDRFVEVGRRRIPKVPALRGRTVATVFAENSTRTRLSFETAARRLSADVLSFAPASSSLSKGESLRDTVETVAAMGVDCFVVRHGSAGVPSQVARWTAVPVVNAGDGWHEHPTQALLDCATVRQALAERDGVAVEDAGTEGFAGLRVAVVGDIAHSRVARSVVVATAALGARVTLVGPGSLLPVSTDGWPVEAVTTDLDAVLPDTDVCYVLRLQTERGAGSFVPTLREYRDRWGLTAARADRLPGDALVLHPGPMVRGVEIADDVAELPRTLVLRQVANGVAVRMAVLFLLLGADGIDGQAGDG